MSSANIAKVIKINKFTTNQSRYCQNCGIESSVLIATIPENKKISQLQYCKNCNNKKEEFNS